MCGIAGALRLDPSAPPLEPAVADRMLEAIWRRGPDGDGQWRCPEDLCWLGHRRLAIIDLVTGDQPMTNEDSSIWTIFNGEIYNFKCLRDELKASGHRFKTESDTEVLLHGYEQWGGEGLVRRLQGLFALAIYDIPNRTLFLARDHLGVKPMFWWTDGQIFLFGSEIKSLLPHPGLAQRKVNRAGIAQFLVSRYVSRPNTMFEGLNKLPEGSCMTVRVGQAAPDPPVQYWDVSYKREAHAPSFDEAVEQLDVLLKETVRMQLMSDVPLGAQLSGGVDSSVVVALMDIIRRESGEKEKVKTFSVGFDVDSFSELPYARQIAERYDTEHHEIFVGHKDFARLLPFLAWIYDEPIGEPPAIPTYAMCKRAKEHVTVMLCGEGADEQFGGYSKYAFDQYSRYVDWVPAGVRKAALRGMASMMPFKMRRHRAILEVLSLSDPSSRYASWYGALDTSVQATLLDPELREEVGDRFLRDVFVGLLQKCDSKGRLEQFLYSDIHTRLVDNLLVKGDRMSMGASVEARVPFLDHKVVEFAAGLPPEYKVNGLRTKILLKKLAERYAPMDIIYRRKVGFTLPLSAWFAGPLQPLIREVLLSERCMSRGYWKPDALKQIVDDHLELRVDREQGIWVLLTLELWHRLYVDDDGSEAAYERVKAGLDDSISALVPFTDSFVSADVKRPRLMIVGPLPPPVGGVENFTKVLLDSDAFGAFEVSHFDLTKGRPKQTQGRFDLGNMRWAYLHFRQFRAALRRVRPEVVYMPVTGTWSGFFRDAVLARIAVRFGCKAVGHVHGGWFNRILDAKGWKERVVRSTLDKFDALLVLGTPWESMLQDYGFKGTVEIAPATSRAEIFEHGERVKRDYTATEPHGLFVGQVGHRKGVYDMLAAMSKLKGEGLRPRITFCGPAEFQGEWEAVMKRVEELGLKDDTDFAGPQQGEAVLDLYKTCDYFIMPSYEEGFPAVLLEAAGFKLPIITTPVGAVSDFLTDKLNSLLVAPGDVEAIAQAIRELTVNPELRKRLGAQALVDVQRFRPEYVSRQVADAIERAITR